jgi:hypothetical protein
MTVHHQPLIDGRHGCDGAISFVALSSRARGIGAPSVLTRESGQDACAAREAAERKYGFSERHGEARAA